jgi:hypothetical protein
MCTHAETSFDAACCPPRPDSCADAPGIDATTSSPPPIAEKMRKNSRRSSSNR